MSIGLTKTNDNHSSDIKWHVYTYAEQKGLPCFKKTAVNAAPHVTYGHVCVNICL